MTSTIKKVPKLRFPGFNDEWEEKKLGGITIVNPKSSSLPDKFYYIDLESVKNGKLLKQSMISKIKAPSRAQRLLKNDDIIYQTVRPYQKNNYFFDLDGDYVASTGYAQIRTAIEHHSRFIYVILHTNNFVNKVLVRSTGTNYPAINSNDLAKIFITLPAKPEQEKIAAYVTSVDEKIDLVSKKKELLEKYKKGVMQQIFSQKVRFKDEEGQTFPTWKEKRLSDIAIKENSSVSANEIEDRSGNYKVYGASGFLQTLDEYQQDENYTAIVKDGAGVGRLLWCEAKSTVLGTLNIIKPKTGNDSRFLHYLLGTINFAKYSIGSTIPHVYFNDYSKQKISTPSLDEQKKIADFLSVIDEKIEAEERKLVKAKEFKKALLQQMFV